jgi:hypothetical protein
MLFEIALFVKYIIVRLLRLTMFSPCGVKTPGFLLQNPQSSCSIAFCPTFPNIQIQWKKQEKQPAWCWMLHYNRSTL